jgi:hypothetical protein
MIAAERARPLTDSFIINLPIINSMNTPQV